MNATKKVIKEKLDALEKKLQDDSANNVKGLQDQIAELLVRQKATEDKIDLILSLLQAEKPLSEMADY